METNIEILQFLDGSISAANENELFLKLATDSDLRAELRDLALIDRAVTENSDYFLPMSGSTAKVMASVGINGKVSGPVPKILGPIVPPRKLNPWLSAAISSVLTVAIMLYIFSDNISPDKQKLQPQTISQTEARLTYSIKVEKEEFLNNNSLNAEDSMLSSVNSNALHQRSSLHGLTDNMPENELNTTGNNQVDDSPEYIREQLFSENHRSNFLEKSDIARSPDISESPRLAVQRHELIDRPATSLNSPVDVEDIENNLYDNTGLVFNLFMNAYQYNTRSQKSVKNIPNFHNMGFSLAYQFNYAMSAGAEIRREKFYQNFEDEENYYYQIPDFTTYSLFLTYNYPIVRQIAISSRLTLGANVAGIVCRPMMGMQYTLSGVYQVNAGAEYNLLAYSHNNAVFYSGKLGIYFGIGLKL